MSLGGDLVSGYNAGLKGLLARREMEEEERQPSLLSPLAWPKVGTGRMRSSRPRGNDAMRPPAGEEYDNSADVQQRLNYAREQRKELREWQKEKNQLVKDAYLAPGLEAPTGKTGSTDQEALDAAQERIRQRIKHHQMGNGTEVAAGIAMERDPVNAWKIEKARAELNAAKSAGLKAGPDRLKAAQDRYRKVIFGQLKGMGITDIRYPGDGTVEVDWSDGTTKTGPADEFGQVLVGISEKWNKPVEGKPTKTPKSDMAGKDVLTYLADTSKSDWDAALKMATTVNEQQQEVVDEIKARRIYNESRAQKFANLAALTKTQAKSMGLKDFGKIKEEIKDAQDSAAGKRKNPPKPQTPTGLAAYIANHQMSENPVRREMIREKFPQIYKEAFRLVGWKVEEDRPPKRGILAVEPEIEENQLI